MSATKVLFLYSPNILFRHVSTLIHAQCSDPIKLKKHPCHLKTRCLLSWLWVEFPALGFTAICFERTALLLVSTSSPLHSLLQPRRAAICAITHRHCSYYGHQRVLTGKSSGTFQTLLFLMTYLPLWTTSFFKFFKSSLPLFLISLSFPPVSLKTPFQSLL